MDWKDSFPIGSQWRTRRGSIITIATHSPIIKNNGRVMADSDGIEYRLDGRWYEDDTYGGDLVERIDIPSPAEVKREFRVGDKVKPKPDSEFKGDELPWVKRGDHLTRGEFVIAAIDNVGYDHRTAPNPVLCAKSRRLECIPLSCLTLVKAVEEKDNLEKKEDKLICYTCNINEATEDFCRHCKPCHERNERMRLAVEPEKTVQTPGYLPCVDGKTQLWWPSVRPVTIKQPHETCAMCGIWYRKYQTYRAGCVECGSVLPSSKK